ncbi:MAG: SDR family NAD(P)-dependent oxidoreductase [Crocinitomicaceae bacterium]
MNKQIVVIGASRGIGAALVKRYAANPNHHVFAFSRNLKAMESLFTEKNVTCFSLDLSADVKNQFSHILDQLPLIDVLVENAGFLVNKPFSALSHEDITTSYQVNVIGVMESIQCLLPKLNPEGAHIVNISSMGGFQGSMKFAGLAAYSTSKAALCSFTELFAEEFKSSNIKMNCLCLGAVQTEMLAEAFPGYEAPLSPEQMATFIEDFSFHAQHYMNGKIVPVSLTNP